MEATLLSSRHSHPQFFPPLHSGKSLVFKSTSVLCRPRYAKTPQFSLRRTNSELSRKDLGLSKGLHCLKMNWNLSLCINDQLRGDYLRVKAASADSLNHELLVPNTDDNSVDDGENLIISYPKPPRYKNRYLNFVHMGTLFNNAAESFFKSEICRRLFVTALLLVMSRVGYFIHLPGFDRKLMPEDYLRFVSGSVDELGDFAPELKLSFFQLGISPQIVASIVMQVLCHLVPSLVKLRKEGLDGQKKIKSYIWWISLCFGTVEGLILACYSLPYSIYAETSRVKHVMVTTLLLVSGAMTMSWICEKNNRFWFWTRIIFDYLCWNFVWLQRNITQVVDSGFRQGSPITEVEPYIPFNINPSGMQPILTTTYLLADPSILAGLLGSPVWEYIKQMLNPETSTGAGPWVYYTIYSFFVFVFNIFDIANMPKEVSDYLNKMGARILKIKPGKATIEYLTKVQAFTSFWGGLLLATLATTSSILDHYLRSNNLGFSISFTSVLIIVGSIIELRRSYQAYNVMPSLSKALKDMVYNI